MTYTIMGYVGLTYLSFLYRGLLVNVIDLLLFLLFEHKHIFKSVLTFTDLLNNNVLDSNTLPSCLSL